MPDITEIDSWYSADDHFDPSARLPPELEACVRQVEEVAKAEGGEIDFAEALIALSRAEPGLPGEDSAVENTR